MSIEIFVLTALLVFSFVISATYVVLVIYYNKLNCRIGRTCDHIIENGRIYDKYMHDMKATIQALEDKVNKITSEDYVILRKRRPEGEGACC
jgi:uncharacterized protein YoxC